MSAQEGGGAVASPLVKPLEPESRERKPACSNVTLAIVGSLMTFFNLSLTMCMCGLQGLDGLPGSAVGAALAWWAFFRKSRGGVPARLLVSAAAIFTTYFLLRNIHNVLWSGHDSLW